MLLEGEVVSGSAFIKTVLPYKSRTMVVVDISENYLAELTRQLRSTNGMYILEDYVTYPMDFASKIFEKLNNPR